MPLDTSTLNLQALEMSSGFLAAYQFSADGLSPISENADENDDQAQRAWARWQTLSSLTHADMMMLRRDGEVSIASQRGGLIVTARNVINIGILRKIVKSLPSAKLSHDCSLTAPGFDGGKGALWAIAGRIGRVEVARTFEMMIGQFEYVLHANKTGFAIVDDDGGADRFVAKIHEAVEAAFDIEYTLGDKSTGSESSHHTLAELFGTSEDATWQYDATGWPIAVPPHAHFADIELGSKLSQALNIDPSEKTSVDLLDDSGKIILSGRTENGEVVFKQIPSVA